MDAFSFVISGSVIGSFLKLICYCYVCFHTLDLFGKFWSKILIIEHFVELMVCLSKRTTDEGLRECFAKFGEVLHARVVKDRTSGWSKGFGFVRYSTLEEAAAGIEGMDGKFLDGWVIFAEYARPRDSPPPSSPSYGNNQYGRQ
ncbi:putative RNA recognition motif domain, nucleotide-binding alpha-beta plait domain superfamily [Helianthus annuus]|nr:putative RNA recognition motif domain, nucleotide-binding alpha-beta plait domain superfamily [Helianthus annuus]